MCSFIAAQGPITGTATTSTPWGTASSESPGWKNRGSPEDGGLDVDAGVRVGGQQRADVGGVDVVGVLVGDEDRVQVAQVVPGAGEVPGVDQDEPDLR